MTYAPHAPFRVARCCFLLCCMVLVVRGLRGGGVVVVVAVIMDVLKGFPEHVIPKVLCDAGACPCRDDVSGRSS